MNRPNAEDESFVRQHSDHESTTSTPEFATPDSWSSARPNPNNNFFGPIYAAHASDIQGSGQEIFGDTYLEEGTRERKRHQSILEVDSAPRKRRRGLHPPDALGPQEPPTNERMRPTSSEYGEPYNGTHDMEMRDYGWGLRLGLTNNEHSRESHAVSPFRAQYIPRRPQNSDDAGSADIPSSQPLRGFDNETFGYEGRSQHFQLGHETALPNRQSHYAPPHHNPSVQESIHLPSTGFKLGPQSLGLNTSAFTPPGGSLRDIEGIANFRVQQIFSKRTAEIRQPTMPPPGNSTWLDASRKREPPYNSTELSVRAYTPQSEAIRPNTLQTQRGRSQRIALDPEVYMNQWEEHNGSAPQTGGHDATCGHQPDVRLDSTELYKSFLSPSSASQYCPSSSNSRSMQTSTTNKVSRESMGLPFRANQTRQRNSQAPPTNHESGAMFTSNYEWRATVAEQNHTQSRRVKKPSDIGGSQYGAVNIHAASGPSSEYLPKWSFEPQLPDSWQPLGAGHTSPISSNTHHQVNYTPSRFPVNVSARKTEQMTPRRKKATVLTAGVNTAQTRQRIAAEIIVRKEQEALEQDIFGEIIVDTQEEKEEKARLARAEAQRKRDESEREQSIKAEVEMLADLENRRLQAEAADRERHQKEREEELKQAKREVEREKQKALDEAAKEDKRKKAAEQILFLRQQEVLKREEKQHEREKELSLQVESARLTELQLRREISKLRAASLKTTLQKKEINGNPAIPDEESLFIPEDSASAQGHIYDVDERSARPTKPKGVAELSAPRSNFRDRIQEDRAAFEAQRKADFENEKAQKLRDRFSSRYTPKSTPESQPADKAVTVSRRPENSSKKSSLFSKLRTKSKFTNRAGSTISLPPAPQLPATHNTGSEKGNQKLPEKRASANILPPPMPPPRVEEPPSGVKLISNVELEELQNVGKVSKQKRTQQQREDRRRRDGERARDNHCQKLLKDAKEGGYTLTEDELNKRLDAYMTKREEKWKQRRTKQSDNTNPQVSNTMPILQTGPSTQIHVDTPIHNQQEPLTEAQTTTVTSDPYADLDPDQRTRKQNEIDMREAMMALAKTSACRSRFAKTSAKRIVCGFQYDSDESGDSSEESVEDPDEDGDEPAVTTLSTLAAKDSQGNDIADGEPPAVVEELFSDAFEDLDQTTENFWHIQFSTVTDRSGVDKGSEGSDPPATVVILPGHRYSDVALANQAACDYLHKYLRPKRPVIAYLEQHENELGPALREARDEYSSQGLPFSCGIERSETQIQWVAEKEARVEVVAAGSQGLAN